jgi:FemAB-related protein (PEP-CTERM system-associated)
VSALARARTDAIAVSSDVPEHVWDRFVLRHEQATGYHLSAWMRVIEHAFGHETTRFAALDGSEIVGVLPVVFFRSRLFGRFAVSMPFLNYGGVASSSPAGAAALLAAAVDATRRRRGDYLALRHTRRQFPDLPARTHKVAMTLALRGSTDEQWLALDKKVRNQIRKAEKSGIGMTEGGLELLEPFYEVFARNMRDLGTPVYPIGLFRDVLRQLPGSTRVFCAWRGEQPVAGSLVFWHGGRIEVPWASSIREFNAFCPNVLLYWSMLRFAIERGFPGFDFGRSTPDEGTFHFKRQWGAEPSPLVWEHWTADGKALPDLSPANPRFQRAIATWQRLPVALTRLIGPPIVRNIP